MSIPVPKRRGNKRIAAIAIGAILALVAAELGFRLFEGRLGVNRSDIWVLRGYVCNRSARFVPTAYKGWVWKPGEAEVNSDGFLDEEHVVEKPEDVLRIACLGGSTTAGNRNFGIAGTYPHQLGLALAEKSSRAVEVLNFGIPGWTTAETLVNYVLHVQDFAPDVVIVHHALNDALPRLWAPYRSDYTHYRHPWEWRTYGPLWRFVTRFSDLFAAWQLETWQFRLDDQVAVPPEVVERQGTAVLPETAVGFRRNVATLCELVRLRGGRPVLMTMPYNEEEELGPLDERRVRATEDDNRILRELAAELGVSLFDLAAQADAQLRATFVDLIHFSPEGNAYKARMVADFLIREGLVPGP